jgi:hypothetical protein
MPDYFFLGRPHRKKAPPEVAGQPVNTGKYQLVFTILQARRNVNTPVK